MKAKKLFLSVLASLAVAGSVVSLASCGGEEENKSTPTPTPSDVTPTPTDPGTDPTPTPTNPGTDPTPTPTPTPTVNQDQLKVEAALKALSLDEIQNENFELKVLGAGNVAITWTSSNTDVISIDGSSATVTRPGFAGENATVTLTATAISGSVQDSKEFTVTVEKLEDESITVAEAKALELKDTAYIHGIVTGYCYNKSDTGGFAAGFYLTDATGTIYVYGSQTATEVALGDEVYLKGTRAEYSNGMQMSYPEDVQIISQGNNADWTTVITDKTIADIQANIDVAGNNLSSNVYQLKAKIYKDSYGNYGLEDLNDTSKTLGVYLGGSSGTAPDAYSAMLDQYIGQVVNVRFVVNSTNSAGSKWRGHVLEVLPFSVEDQLTYAESSIKASVGIDSKITSAEAIKLPTEISLFDKTTIVWSLKDGSTGATLENNVLTPAPTDTLQQFTLVATITVEGNDPIIVEIIAQVKNSFDPMTYEEYMAAADAAEVTIKGYVSLISGNNVFLTDANGNGYYLYGAVTGAQLGEEYIVTGEKDIYNNLHEIKNFEAEKTGNSKTIDPTDVTDEITTNGFTVTTENQNKYVVFTGVLKNSTTVTVGNHDVALYFKSGQTTIAAGSTVTVTGIYSVYKTTSQIQIWSSDAVVLVSAPEGGDEPETPEVDGTKVSLEKTAFPSAYPSNNAEATITVDGYTWGFQNVANYGSGIQIKATVGTLYNKTALEGNITKITFQWSDAKTVYTNENFVKIELGTDDTYSSEVVYLSTVSGVKEYSIDISGEYTYIRISNALTYAQYWENITVYYGESTGTDTPVEPETPVVEEISIGEAIQIGSANASGVYTEEKYKVTGVITEVANTTYGNIYITDGTNTIYLYGLYDADGNRYDKMTTKPGVGDTIVIEGVLGNYNGSAQFQNATLISLTPASDDYKAEVELDRLVGLFAESYIQAANVNLTSTVGTVDVTLQQNATTLAYENGILTITPGAAEVIETVTIKVTIGSAVKEQVVNIKSVLDSSTISVSIADYADAEAWANSIKYTTLVVDSSTSVTVAGGANSGKYYTSGEQWRIYQNESPSITITSDKTIASVVIEYVSQNTGVLLNDTTQIESGTAITVGASTITLGVGNTGSATNGQVRITKITINYA